MSEIARGGPESEAVDWDVSARVATNAAPPRDQGFRTGANSATGFTPVTCKRAQYSLGLAPSVSPLHVRLDSIDAPLAQTAYEGLFLLAVNAIGMLSANSMELSLRWGGEEFVVVWYDGRNSVVVI